jgi:hypothetical protein
MNIQYDFVKHQSINLKEFKEKEQFYHENKELVNDSVLETLNDPNLMLLDIGAILNTSIKHYNIPSNQNPLVFEVEVAIFKFEIISKNENQITLALLI